jgi:neutral ceramidase
LTTDAANSTRLFFSSFQGYLDFGTTRISDANINRSPFAYLANPESERTQYTDDVDKDLTLLRFRRASDGKNMGVLTWFAVHGTSMLGNNTHVTGDNKGLAAYLFEQSVQGNEQAADGFVAGFSQANVGDTTPNVLGAWCDDGSGQMCDFETSTCADGKSQSCHGRGPFFQKLDLGVASCFEIGRRQFSGARGLYVSKGTPFPLLMN